MRARCPKCGMKDANLIEERTSGDIYTCSNGECEHSFCVHRDPVNSPSHYKDRVPGIECIDVTKHFDFLRGNAIKYLWRAGLKGDTEEDLRKAIWYIEKEIEEIKKL